MSKVKCQMCFKQGFSIVELLVVVAIVIIMTGILFASMSGNKSQKDAENAARQVAAQLRQLQNEAVNGKQIDDEVVCQFNFNSSAGSKGYAISYRDCPIGESQVGDSVPIKLNSGKGNVSIDRDSSVSFSAPNGEHSNSTISFEGGKAYVCVCKENIFDTKNSTDCSSC